MKIVHIIPTYNEKENIGMMIDEIFRIGKKYPRWDNHVVVVDDKSPDNTAGVVKEYVRKYKKIHLISKNKEGLGCALIKGYEFAVKNLNADVVIPNDADFQWNPRDYPRLVEKIEEGFDVVVASRHVRGGRVDGWNWFRKLNHEISNTLLAWWLAGVHEVRDHAGNFKAIRVKNILEKVNLSKMKNAGFSFQLHILYELSKTGAKFHEEPVIFKNRKFGKSKIGFNKYYLRDVFEYIKSSFIIRIDRSQRFLKYGIIGFFGYILQTLIAALLINSGINPDNSVAVGAEGAIIFNFILNNLWTFSHHRISGLRLMKKFLQFNLFSLAAILIQKYVVLFGTSYFGKSTWFFFMVFSIVFLVIPLNYFLYNRFIWKTDINKKRP